MLSNVARFDSSNIWFCFIGTHDTLKAVAICQRSECAYILADGLSMGYVHIFDYRHTDDPNIRNISRRWMVDWSRTEPGAVDFVRVHFCHSTRYIFCIEIFQGIG